jgi:hypothetical protein
VAREVGGRRGYTLCDVARDVQDLQGDDEEKKKFKPFFIYLSGESVFQECLIYTCE